MEYIPRSRIFNEDRRKTVVKLLLFPDDIINHIFRYDNEFLDITGNEDMVWINLGIETCNLFEWNRNCRNILQQSFGKTKFCFVCDLYDSFSRLKSLLNDLVESNYPFEIKNIKYNSEDIDIIDLFVKSQDLVNYPISLRSIGKKYKKSITSNDKEYIMTFIERMDIYLSYMEQNIRNLIVNNAEKKYTKEKKNEILQIIKKMKKKCDKMRCINDVPIVD